MLDRDFKPPDGEGGAGLTNHNISKNTHSAQERLQFINKVFCDTAFFEEELWETPQSHFPGLARSVVKKSIPSRRMAGSVAIRSRDPALLDRGTGALLSNGSDRLEMTVLGHAVLFLFSPAWCVGVQCLISTRLSLRLLPFKQDWRTEGLRRFCNLRRGSIGTRR